MQLSTKGKTIKTGFGALAAAGAAIAATPGQLRQRIAHQLEMEREFLRLVSLLGVIDKGEVRSAVNQWGYEVVHDYVMALGRLPKSQAQVRAFTLYRLSTAVEFDALLRLIDELEKDR